MKIIYCKHIPPKGFSMLFFFGLLIIRKDCKDRITSYGMRHEAIHQKQCREMLYIFFYLWYVIEWLIRIVQYRKSKEAYYNTSFEREAYDNQYMSNYLKERKRYSWLAYLYKKAKN